MPIALVVVVALLTGCTPVVVVDSSGSRVANAEVFVDGQLRGTTNSSGQFAICLSSPVARSCLLGGVFTSSRRFVPITVPGPAG